MRLSELSLALSWFCLLLAIRAFLPLRIPPLETFFRSRSPWLNRMGATGEAESRYSPEHERACLRDVGERICRRQLLHFRRHMVPQLLPLLLMQTMILIPQFIMAEDTVSFLGLCATEPLASSGNLLADSQQSRVLSSYWWLTTPMFALILFSFSYFLVVNSLQRKVQSVAA